MTSIRSRAPRASSRQVRKVMQANVGRVTAVENLVHATLRRSGLRFMTDTRPEPGIKCRADVVFSHARVCVFVDGCYWHGCPVHFRVPKTNAAWWTEKITDNRIRDARQARLLRRRGWTVFRVWEHTSPDHLALLCAQIRAVVGVGARRRDL